MTLEPSLKKKHTDSGIFSGPGADRVIFTGDGTYEGVITHTGATGNDFLQCTAD